MDQYPSISPNILKNSSMNCSMTGLWIYLIILHVRKAFEDASCSKYGFICNSYSEFWICLDIARYATIMPQYALIPLSMPEHGWILLKSLNMSENVWINCSDSQHASSLHVFHMVLNMCQSLNMPKFWICCDIVIITLLL